MADKVLDGRYRLERQLESDPISRSYLARELEGGRQVVVRVLNPDLSGGSQVAKKFLDIAPSAAAFRHPNTTRILGFGRTEQGILYLALAPLDGETLRRRINDLGKLPVGKALHIARQILLSLEEAHGAGVVHQGLCPENVYLLNKGGDDSYVKVTGYGVFGALVPGASAEQLAAWVASPSCLSPEQVGGREGDSFADLYATGVILYEMISGEPPFTADDREALFRQLIHEKPLRPTRKFPELRLPAGLESMLMYALAKSPQLRLASARAMRQELERSIDALPANERVAFEMPPQSSPETGGPSRASKVTAALRPKTRSRSETRGEPPQFPTKDKRFYSDEVGKNKRPGKAGDEKATTRRSSAESARAGRAAAENVAARRSTAESARSGNAAAGSVTARRSSAESARSGNASAGRGREAVRKSSKERPATRPSTVAKPKQPSSQQPTKARPVKVLVLAISLSLLSGGVALYFNLTKPNRMKPVISSSSMKYIVLNMLTRPSGAAITAGPQGCISPCSLKLVRGRRYKLIASKSGYKPKVQLFDSIHRANQMLLKLEPLSARHRSVRSRRVNKSSAYQKARRKAKRLRAHRRKASRRRKRSSRSQSVVTSKSGSRSRLSKGTLSKIFSRKKKSLMSCYRRTVGKTTSKRTLVMVRFQVTGATGRVTDFRTLLNTSKNEELSACIETRLKRWRFPAFKNASMTVVYPLVFR